MNSTEGQGFLQLSVRCVDSECQTSTYTIEVPCGKLEDYTRLQEFCLDQLEKKLRRDSCAVEVDWIRTQKAEDVRPKLFDFHMTEIQPAALIHGSGKNVLTEGAVIFVCRRSDTYEAPRNARTQVRLGFSGIGGWGVDRGDPTFALCEYIDNSLTKCITGGERCVRDGRISIEVYLISGEGGPDHIAVLDHGQGAHGTAVADAFRPYFSPQQQVGIDKHDKVREPDHVTEINRSRLKISADGKMSHFGIGMKEATVTYGRQLTLITKTSDSTDNKHLMTMDWEDLELQLKKNEGSLQMTCFKRPELEELHLGGSRGSLEFLKELVTRLDDQPSGAVVVVSHLWPTIQELLQSEDGVVEMAGHLRDMYWAYTGGGDLLIARNESGCELQTDADSQISAVIDIRLIDVRYDVEQGHVRRFKEYSVSALQAPSRSDAANMEGENEDEEGEPDDGGVEETKGEHHPVPRGRAVPKLSSALDNLMAYSKGSPFLFTVKLTRKDWKLFGVTLPEVSGALLYVPFTDGKENMESIANKWSPTCRIRACWNGRGMPNEGLPYLAFQRPNADRKPHKYEHRVAGLIFLPRMDQASNMKLTLEPRIKKYLSREDVDNKKLGYSVVPMEVGVWLNPLGDGGEVAGDLAASYGKWIEVMHDSFDQVVQVTERFMGYRVVPLGSVRGQADREVLYRRMSRTGDDAPDDEGVVDGGLQRGGRKSRGSSLRTAASRFSTGDLVSFKLPDARGKHVVPIFLSTQQTNAGAKRIQPQRTGNVGFGEILFFSLGESQLEGVQPTRSLGLQSAGLSQRETDIIPKPTCNVYLRRLPTYVYGLCNWLKVPAESIQRSLGAKASQGFSSRRGNGVGSKAWLQQHDDKLALQKIVLRHGEDIIALSESEDEPPEALSVTAGGETCKIDIAVLNGLSEGNITHYIAAKSFSLDSAGGVVDAVESEEGETGYMRVGHTPPARLYKGAELVLPKRGGALLKAITFVVVIRRLTTVNAGTQQGDPASDDALNGTVVTVDERTGRARWSRSFSGKRDIGKWEVKVALHCPTFGDAVQRRLVIEVKPGLVSTFYPELKLKGGRTPIGEGDEIGVGAVVDLMLSLTHKDVPSPLPADIVASSISLTIGEGSGARLLPAPDQMHPTISGDRLMLSWKDLCIEPGPGLELLAHKAQVVNVKVAVLGVEPLRREYKHLTFKLLSGEPWRLRVKDPELGTSGLLQLEAMAPFPKFDVEVVDKFGFPASMPAPYEVRLSDATTQIAGHSTGGNVTRSSSSSSGRSTSCNARMFITKDVALDTATVGFKGEILKVSGNDVTCAVNGECSKHLLFQLHKRGCEEPAVEILSVPYTIQRSSAPHALMVRQENEKGAHRLNATAVALEGVAGNAIALSACVYAKDDMLMDVSTGNFELTPKTSGSLPQGVAPVCLAADVADEEGDAADTLARRLVLNIPAHIPIAVLGKNEEYIISYTSGGPKRSPPLARAIRVKRCAASCTRVCVESTLVAGGSSSQAHLLQVQCGVKASDPLNGFNTKIAVKGYDAFSNQCTEAQLLAAVNSDNPITVALRSSSSNCQPQAQFFRGENGAACPSVSFAPFGKGSSLHFQLPADIRIIGKAGKYTLVTTFGGESELLDFELLHGPPVKVSKAPGVAARVDSLVSSHNLDGVELMDAGGNTITLADARETYAFSLQSVNGDVAQVSRVDEGAPSQYYLKVSWDGAAAMLKPGQQDLSAAVIALEVRGSWMSAGGEGGGSGRQREMELEPLIVNVSVYRSQRRVAGLIATSHSERTPAAGMEIPALVAGVSKNHDLPQIKVRLAAENGKPAKVDDITKMVLDVKMLLVEAPRKNKGGKRQKVVRASITPVLCYQEDEARRESETGTLYFVPPFPNELLSTSGKFQLRVTYQEERDFIINSWPEDLLTITKDIMPLVSVEQMPPPPPATSSAPPRVPSPDPPSTPRPVSNENALNATGGGSFNFFPSTPSLRADTADESAGGGYVGASAESRNGLSVEVTCEDEDPDPSGPGSGGASSATLPTTAPEVASGRRSLSGLQPASLDPRGTERGNNERGTTTKRPLEDTPATPSPAPKTPRPRPNTPRAPHNMVLAQFPALSKCFELCKARIGHLTIVSDHLTFKEGNDRQLQELILPPEVACTFVVTENEVEQLLPCLTAGVKLLLLKGDDVRDADLQRWRAIDRTAIIASELVEGHTDDSDKVKSALLGRTVVLRTVKCALDAREKLWRGTPPQQVDVSIITQDGFRLERSGALTKL